MSSMSKQTPNLINNKKFIILANIYIHKPLFSCFLSLYLYGAAPAPSVVFLPTTVFVPTITTTTLFSTITIGGIAMSHNSTMNYADFVAIGGFFTFMSSIFQSLGTSNKYLSTLLLVVNTLSSAGTSSALVSAQPNSLTTTIIGLAISVIILGVASYLSGGAVPGAAPIYNAAVGFAGGGAIGEINALLVRTNVLPPVT